MSSITKSLVGKICIVTGATSGIGAMTAQALALQGATTVIVGRNSKKGIYIVNKIKKNSSNSSVEFMLADLSSRKEIRQLAEKFKQRYQHLDVLVNNAGAKFLKRQLTVDGCEMTFALNHLSCFFLVNLLLEPLKKSENARIINVSSSAHGSSHGIDFDDLQSRKEYDGKKAYAQSKLANILFTYELARRLNETGITVNALHPGAVITNFSRNNGLISWTTHVVAHLLARNLVGPVEGAKTSIYLATSPEVKGVTGKYFVNQKEARSSKASYNKEAAMRLWQVSLELSGLLNETEKKI